MKTRLEKAHQQKRRTCFLQVYFEKVFKERIPLQVRVSK